MTAAATIDARVQAAFALHRAGDHAGAAAGYRAVLRIEPDNADALNLLASASRSLGDVAAAVELSRRAAEIAPLRVDILYNLGNAEDASGAYDRARDAWERVLSLDPGHAEAAANIAVAFGREGRYAEAVEAYRRALAIDPKQKIAVHNIGNALGELGRGTEAVAAFRRCLAAHPDLAEARYNMSLALLRLGDFAQGFAAYEWRWKSADFSHPPRHTTLPDWTGRPFPGKRLLVHAEQGLGDTIQFIRLVRLAASLGGEVVVEVPDALRRLVAPLPFVGEILAENAPPAGIDVQSPLLGLPHRMRLTLGAIPDAPYLVAEPAKVAEWSRRLKPGTAGFVALCWRGNPKSPADRGRSIVDSGLLAPLKDGGRRLVCVMKLAADEIEPADTASGWRVRGLPIEVEHPGPDFDGGSDAFVDAAAVLALADGVVTTDTSMAHLAGALGRPVLTLLKHVPDWRWLAAGETTPWYPTMRLARQTVAGDWNGPVGTAVRWISALR